MYRFALIYGTRSLIVHQYASRQDDLTMTLYLPWPYMLSRAFLSFVGLLYFCLNITSCHPALAGVDRESDIVNLILELPRLERGSLLSVRCDTGILLLKLAEALWALGKCLVWLCFV